MIPDAPAISVTNEDEARQFSHWLQSVTVTAKRLACWTRVGLDYSGISPEWAADHGLEGWPHE